MTSFSYQGGAGDAIAVTPFANPTVPWNLGVTVAGGTDTPASFLTYIRLGRRYRDGDRQDAGSVVEPSVATVLFSNINQVTVTYLGFPNVYLLPNLTISDAGGTYNGSSPRHGKGQWRSQPGPSRRRSPITAETS